MVKPALCLASVLVSGLCMASSHPIATTDVPDWASQALAGLGATGQPGAKMGRMEAATAVFELARKWSDLADASRQAALKATEALQGQAGSIAGQAVREAALRVEASSTEREDLLKLVQEFERELEALGLDVGELRVRIEGLKSRTARLEGRSEGICVYGDATLFAWSGNSLAGLPGLALSGQSVGVRRGTSQGKPSGLGSDLAVLHEWSIGIEGQAAKGISFRGVLAAGNMLNTFGSLRGITPLPALGEGQSDVYVDEASGRASAAILGQGLSAEAGRTKVQMIPYVLRLSDRTPYWRSQRTDSGDYRLDGIRLEAKRGRWEVLAFGGRLAGQSMGQGTPLTPGTIRIPGLPAAAQADRVAGVMSTLAFRGGKLRTAWLEAGSDTLAGGRFNRLQSAGFQADGERGKLKWSAGASTLAVLNGRQVVKSRDSSVLHASLDYSTARAGASLAWRDVDTYFRSMGSGGRFASLFGPTGVRHFAGRAWVRALPTVRLTAGFDNYAGRPASDGRTGTLLIGKGETAASVVFEVLWQTAPDFSLGLDFEDAVWRLQGRNHPRQRWITLNTNWTASPQASLRSFVQWSEADDFGTGVFAGLGLGASRYRGLLVGTQLSLRY